MKILALDSSSPVSSVAFVVLGGHKPTVLFDRTAPHPRTDSSVLFSGLEQAVNSCGQPDVVAVGLGPGSYNGLRAGIAAARAYATARNIFLYAFPSPLGLQGPKPGFWAAGNARGGQYWVACVEGSEHGLSLLEQAFLISPSLAAMHFQRRPSFPILSASPLDGIDDVVIASPNAALLALQVENRKSFLPCSPEPATPEPLYLKPPHITAQRPVVSRL